MSRRTVMFRGSGGLSFCDCSAGSSDREWKWRDLLKDWLRDLPMDLLDCCCDDNDAPLLVEAKMRGKNWASRGLTPGREPQTIPRFVSKAVMT